MYDGEGGGRIFIEITQYARGFSYDSSEGKKITNSFKAIFHIQELMR